MVSRPKPLPALVVVRDARGSCPVPLRVRGRAQSECCSDASLLGTVTMTVHSARHSASPRIQYLKIREPGGQFAQTGPCCCAPAAAASCPGRSGRALLHSDTFPRAPQFCGRLESLLQGAARYARTGRRLSDYCGYLLPSSQTVCVAPSIGAVVVPAVAVTCIQLA